MRSPTTFACSSLSCISIFFLSLQIKRQHHHKNIDIGSTHRFALCQCASSSLICSSPLLATVHCRNLFTFGAAFYLSTLFLHAFNAISTSESLSLLENLLLIARKRDKVQLRRSASSDQARSISVLVFETTLSLCCEFSLGNPKSTLLKSTKRFEEQTLRQTLPLAGRQSVLNEANFQN